MNRQGLFTIFAVLLLFGVAKATEGERYTYTVDLTEIKDDKLFVQLDVPSIKESEITFFMPKIIPGTYSIADYGRFVSELKAYDKKGRELVVERLDDNSWVIQKANKMVKLSYWIEDSFDTNLEGPGIFQPAGTNFEENKNFVINTAGFFGYFEGMKTLPYDFNIIRPDNFYGGTGLIAKTDTNLSGSLNSDLMELPDNKKVDMYEVENYDRLVDSPLMYSEPDTAVIKVANTEVLISSYSPNKVVSAKEIANTIDEVLSAQNKYLGGKLPVDKYAFVFYFTDQPVTSYGALEHSYSSVYYMPENTIEAMEQQLRDFAAHEFFHIVTPLNIHSEEIHAFDFNDPKMSKHLWLYEGVTEFFAGNVQVKYDLISEEQYLQVMRQKMVTASNFIDSVAFTDISKYTLDQYSNQYYNVYMKGALIGMCLDIKLRELSDGAYGMQNLMADLAKKFGKDQAFQDDQLFDEIASITYPEIGEFLDTYVGGNKPLPFEEIFEKVGVDYIEEETYMDVDFGITNAALGVNQESGKLYIANAGALNKFSELLGLKEGDILLKINDVEIPPLGPELGAYVAARKEELIIGDPYSYTVQRDGEEVKLETTVVEIEKQRVHQVSFDEGATAGQLKLRKAWLKPAN